MRTFAGMIAATGVCAALGCGHGPRSVSDEDPADKIPAIEAAVNNDNRSAIPQLVKALGSDDPAVRFYAIDGLRKLTGNDFGYRYYEDADKRKPALEHWQRWVNDQPTR